MKTNKLWFRAKSYGWGWTPCSWEGWVVLLIYVGYLVWTFQRIDSASHSVSDTMIQFVQELIDVTLILVGICIWKGEWPHWSWGDKGKRA